MLEKPQSVLQLFIYSHCRQIIIIESCLYNLFFFLVSIYYPFSTVKFNKLHFSLIGREIFLLIFHCLLCILLVDEIIKLENFLLSTSNIVRVPWHARQSHNFLILKEIQYWFSASRRLVHWTRIHIVVVGRYISILYIWWWVL